MAVTRRTLAVAYLSYLLPSLWFLVLRRYGTADTRFGPPPGVVDVVGDVFLALLVAGVCTGLTAAVVSRTGVTMCVVGSFDPPKPSLAFLYGLCVGALVYGTVALYRPVPSLVDAVLIPVGVVLGLPLVVAVSLTYVVVPVPPGVITVGAVVLGLWLSVWWSTAVLTTVGNRVRQTS